MDDKQLKSRLEAFPRWKVLAFGIFLTERMIPNFLEFQADSGAHGGAILQCALAKAWSHLEAAPSNIFDTVTEEACAAVAPETEDNFSQFTSAALDAANGTANLLAYVETSDVDRIVESAALLRDTVFMYVSQNLEDQEAVGSQIIDDHPLIKRECLHQAEDLDFLCKLSDEQQTSWTAILRRVLDKEYRGNWLTIGASVPENSIP